MRFATVAIAAFAGLAAAHGHDDAASTAFETHYYTVTSCAPEVTNCPARSTVVSSAVVPVKTSSLVPIYASYSAPAQVPGTTPVQAAATDCAVSIETISTSYTTVIPTVTYITHAPACATTAPASPVVPVPVPTHKNNGTTPSYSPIPVSGASAKSVSALVAVAAGALALFA